MMLRSSLVLVLAASIAACSGSGGNPAAPTSTVVLSTAAGVAVSSEPRSVSAETGDGTEVLRPTSKELTTLAGDWKGFVTLTEHDGDVFKEKVALTLAELSAGVYQGTNNGSTLTLTQGTTGLYDAALITGETKTCDGSAVIYTGSASSDGKTLSISVQGISDDCTLEILDFDLKQK